MTNRVIGTAECGASVVRQRAVALLKGGPISEVYRPRLVPLSTQNGECQDAVLPKPLGQGHHRVSRPLKGGTKLLSY